MQHCNAHGIARHHNIFCLDTKQGERFSRYTVSRYVGKNCWRVSPTSSNVLIHEPLSLWYAKTPLPRQAVHYLWWGLIAKTRITYHSVRKSYVSYYWIAGVLLFPALLFNLAYWIAELRVRNLKAKTIKSYLAVMRSSQVEIGTTHDELKIFTHPTHFCTIAGIRRINGKANTREHCPITQQVFLCILPLFDATSL